MMSFLQGLFGPPNVEKMKARRDVKGLIKALGYEKDVSIRQKAAEALGEVGDARAIDPLVAGLMDRNLKVCQAVAESLGKLGDARAVGPLVAALKHRNMCIAVAEALGKIGDAHAVEPLVAVLKDTNHYVREAMTGALVEIGTPAVAPLIAALKGKDRHMRHGAADTLVMIGAPAVEPLIAVLKHSDKDVRSDAASALDKLGWQPGSDEIAAWYWIAKLQWAKCQALGSLAVRPLVAVLVGSSKKDQVNRVAAEILIELYKSDLIESTQKRLILDQKNNIVSKHTDQKSHSDHVNTFHTDVNCTGMSHGDSPSGSHTDKFDGHIDNGVSLEFPL